MTKVSVIVPVHDPGDNIDDLLRTVLDQSLPASDYEVIFVDDGSTDDTPQRLDRLAAEHANVQVIHTPNSGWPGRPRNLGTDAARGEYVLYVDNDDWLGHEALERLVARADADRADVVVGKVVGHGKFVSRPLFRRNRSGVTLEWTPLVTLLSPHKLFRRAFLVEHGIRFPEGRRRLEDHVFVMHAYFHASSISILADYPCYHWMLRDASASYAPFDPVGYFDNLREVLDLIEEHTEPGTLRDRLFVHWYRSKLLKRVGGSGYVRRAASNPDYNRALYEEIHRLALERFGPEHEARLPFNLRLRSRLLRAGDVDGLLALAEFEDGLRATATAYLRATPQGIEARIESAITAANGGELRFARDGERVRWVPPPSLRDRLPADALDATASLDSAKLQLLLRAERDGAEFALPADTERRLALEGVPVLTAQAMVDPAAGAAGAPLSPGDWKLLANPIVAGFTATAPARMRGVASAVKLAVRADGAITGADPPPPPPPPTRTVRVKRRVKRLLAR